MSATDFNYTDINSTIKKYETNTKKLYKGPGIARCMFYSNSVFYLIMLNNKRSVISKDVSCHIGALL